MTALGASFSWLYPRVVSLEHSSAPAARLRETPRREAPIVIESLHDWRIRPVSPLPRSRNLFAFGAPAPKPVVVERREAPPTLSEAAPSLPPPPMLSLVGLAEDAETSGMTRTAIISGSGQLFIVKDGDAVTSRYRVASVSNGVVDLTDLQGGTTLRLVLK